MGEGGSDDHSVCLTSLIIPIMMNSVPDCQDQEGESYCRVMIQELSK